MGERGLTRRNKRKRVHPGVMLQKSDLADPGRLTETIGLVLENKR